ncbi:MAG: type I-U CRISPR-associated protein Csb2, partial [Planctomycetota bacterium]|nr:type I-U CRISPR-associated protein Csb2 [Planctomycetota bacterium]
TSDIMPRLENPHSVFSPHLAVFVLERENSRYEALDITCALSLTSRWREAMLSHSGILSAEAREAISGHDRGGGRLEKPHAAFLALPFVAHKRADGCIRGLAMALPHNLPTPVGREILAAAAKVDVLFLGDLGVWRATKIAAARPPALRSATWTAHPRGATHWSTVTPFIFDYHPKGKARRNPTTAANLIADACERIGLPRPREVVATSVSVHLATPPAPLFPRLRRKDGSERRHTHAIIVFSQPVIGPILIGAGRYRGYGLCLPLSDIP